LILSRKALLEAGFPLKAIEWDAWTSFRDYSYCSEHRASLNSIWYKVFE